MYYIDLGAGWPRRPQASGARTGHSSHRSICLSFSLSIYIYILCIYICIIRIIIIIMI